MVGQRKSASSLPESVVEVLPLAHGHCLSLGMAVGNETETCVPEPRLCYPAQNPGYAMPAQNPGYAIQEEVPGLPLLSCRAPPPPSGCLGLFEDLRSGIAGDELRQSPAWHQAAFWAFHIFTGFTHSPPAGECAEGRKKDRNQVQVRGKERLLSRTPMKLRPEPGTRDP